MNVTIIRTDGTDSQHAVSDFHDIAPLIGPKLSIRSTCATAASCWSTTTDGKAIRSAGRRESRSSPSSRASRLNPTATALYHAVRRPGVTHQIVGDLAIVRDREVADEEDES